jgi:hypothetical protein
MNPRDPTPHRLVSGIASPPGANGLATAQGLLVDATRGALWVCKMGYTTVAQAPSALKRYALASGAAEASYAYELPSDE